MVPRAAKHGASNLTHICKTPWGSTSHMGLQNIATMELQILPMSAKHHGALNPVEVC